MTFDGDKYLDCKDEQSFKMKYIKEVFKKNRKTVFCIETEETVKGFPDTLCIDKATNVAEFFEFKYARQGKIKFEPTQIPFFKAYKDLNIKVVAFDARKPLVYVFPVRCLFDEYGTYRINSRGEVLL